MLTAYCCDPKPAYALMISNICYLIWLTRHVKWNEFLKFLGIKKLSVQYLLKIIFKWAKRNLASLGRPWKECLTLIKTLSRVRVKVRVRVKYNCNSKH